MTADDVSAATPPLVECGAAALAWWRIRCTPELAEDPGATVLRDEYRRVAASALAYERALVAIVRALGAAGLDPLLAKGWAAARVYPEPTLRPCGDLDLLLPRASHGGVEDLLGAVEKRGVSVDLHDAFVELEDRAQADLRARSRVLSLDGAAVRVLGDEDHLALIAIHLLRHGAWRPLWLCDVAAAIESARPDFDWDLCAGTKQRRAGWIRCAIGLAEELLAADTSRVPARLRRGSPPRWVVRSVVAKWERPSPLLQAPMSYRAPMRHYLRDPRGVVADVLRRWPGPLEAAIGVRGPLDAQEPWTFQVGYGVLRALRLFSRANP